MEDSPIVAWTEVPVTDLKKAIAFYNAVFGFDMTIDNSGPMPMAVFVAGSKAVGGHLFVGTPAQGGGNVIHLRLPGTVEDAVVRCKAAGGRVTSPVITIPPGRYAYATDPDGNALGLFQAAS